MKSQFTIFGEVRLSELFYSFYQYFTTGNYIHR